MKSAHKLAAALAVLIALLVAAYFVFLAIHSGAGPTNHDATTTSAAAASTTAQPDTSGGTKSEDPGSSQHDNPAREQAPISGAQPDAISTSGPPAPSPQPSVVTTLEVRPAPEQVSTTVVKEPGITVEVIQPVEAKPQPSGTAENSFPSDALLNEVHKPPSTDLTQDPTSTAIDVYGSSASTSTTTTTVTPSSSSSSPDPTTEASFASSTGTSTPTPTEMSKAENGPQMPTSVSPLSEEENVLWRQFMMQYQKVYPNAQEAQRRAEIFASNLRFINVHNKMSQTSFQLGVNKFADMTPDEINNLYIGPMIRWENSLARSPTMPPPMRILSDEQDVQMGSEALRSIDWRNLTSSVPLDQGSCKESALFAIVASIEATINAALTNASAPRVKLSETQLIDCLHVNAPPPSSGFPSACSGYLSMTFLFDFLFRQSIRLSTYHEYEAYRAANPSGMCFVPPQAGIKDSRPRVSSFGQVHKDNIDEALLNRGPLVVAIDASRPTFHFYKSGVYHDVQCSSDAYNFHALLVGYAPATPDGDTNMAHYTLRASLGPLWGEQGHMRLLKDPSRNKCLPQQQADYPNLAFE